MSHIEFSCRGCGARAGIVGDLSDDDETRWAELDAQYEFERQWDEQHAECDARRPERDGIVAALTQEIPPPSRLTPADRFFAALPEPRSVRVARRTRAAHAAGRMLLLAAADSEPRTTPTLFEVVVTCDKGCGRTVTHHGIAAASEQTAWWVALERMQGDGWRWDDGAVVCRACLLRASGWQSQPGPAEPGREMSVEAIPVTDHSSPANCGCSARSRGAGRDAQESSPAQPSAAGEAAEGTNFRR